MTTVVMMVHIVKGNNAVILIVVVQYQEKIPGVGWAIREGMMAAKGQYLALMSADLETEPEAIDRMMIKIKETNCDLVIGNRWLKGGGFKNYDRKKLVLNWIFQKIFKTLYRTKFGDLTYGFKIIKKEIMSEAYLKEQKIKGDADAEATRIYAKAYGKSPEFYNFIKTLDNF